MLTPQFQLTQDDDYLYVEIRAPYTNIRQTEISYEDRTFLFSSKPYFLRLFLPGDVQAMEGESGSAVVDSCEDGEDGGGKVHGRADYNSDQGRD